MKFVSLQQVGVHIKRHRETKGVSLREVARQLKTHASMLSRYENGLVVPTLTSLWALADYYDVSLDELVGHSSTIDIAPVVRGEWIPWEDRDEGTWECSECG